MSYNVGEAYLQVTVSFRGVAEAIDTEAKKWGLSAGRVSGAAFAPAFRDSVQRGLSGLQVGPSDQDSARRGTQTAGAFADGFKARVTAALRSLPDIQLRADSSAADARIVTLREKLKELSGQRIGIDISEADAIARIDDIKRQLSDLARESPSVSVRMDTAAAAAQLDRLRTEIDRVAHSDPDVTVRANTDEADAKLAATKAAADDAGRSSPLINFSVLSGPAMSAINGIKTALLGLSAGAAITPLVAGATSLLGPLAAVGGGIAGVGLASQPGLSAVQNAYAANQALQNAPGPKQSSQASAGNQVQSAQLALGNTQRTIANNQISSAQAVQSAQTALANTQRTNANNQITSAQAVQSAVQGLSNAQSAAALQVAQADQQVEAAEQTLANAQKASLAAQQALTDARAAAVRSLQDMAFAATDAGLTLRQDQIALTQAQQNLTTVNASTSATAAQRQQAALTLAQAQQRVIEQQVTLQRATVDNTVAQKAGVAGSRQVIAAQNGVVSSHQQLSGATLGLSNAQAAAGRARIAGQQQVQTAEQALANARRAQAVQAAQNAASLVAGQLAVKNAERAQAFQASQNAASLVAAQLAIQNAHNAASNAATGSQTAANNLARALARLTPLERQLYDATLKFKASFTSFGRGLEPVTIPLFTGGLSILQSILPKIRPLIVATANALLKVEQAIGKAVNGPGFAKFVHTLTQLVGPSIASIAKIAGNLAGVFAHVVEAFAPLAKVVLGGLVQLTGALNKATTGPGLKSFVNTMVGLGPIIVKTFTSIGRLIGQVFKTLAPLAGPVLSVISQIAKSLSGVLAAVGPALTSLFRTLAPAINTALQALAPVFKPLVTLIGAVLTALAPILPVIAQLIGRLLPPLAQAFTTIVNALAPLIKQLLPFAPAIIAIIIAFSPLGRIIALISVLGVALAPVIKQFTQALAPVLPVIGKAITALFNGLKPLIPILSKVLVALVPLIKPLADLIVAIVKLAIDLLPLMRLIPPIVRVLVSVINAMVKAFTFVINIIGDVIKWFTNFHHTVTVVSQAISRAWHATMHAIQTAWTAVQDFLKSAWAGFIAVVSTVWNSITAPIARLWNAVVRSVRSAWTATSDFLKGAWNTFVAVVSAVWHAITSPISSAWHSVTSAVKTAWTDVRDFLTSGFHAFASVAASLWNTIAHAIGSAFGAVKGAVAAVWHDVESIFAGAVNFVSQDILNPLVRILDSVLGVFGVKIPQIARITVGGFAAGGVLPGYSPGVDNLAIPTFMFSGGEGILVPEATRALGGEAGIQAINSRYSARVSPPGHFAGGGTVPLTPEQAVAAAARQAGDLGGIGFQGVGAAINKIKDAVRRGAADVVVGLLKAAEYPLQKILGFAGSPIGSTLSHGIFDKLNTAVYSFIRGHVKPPATGGHFAGATVGGAGELAVWKNLRAVGMSAIQAAGVMGNMQSESGFNPFIIQGGGTSTNPADAGGGGYGLVQWTPGAKLIPYLHGQAPSVATEIAALAAQLSGQGPSPEGAAGGMLRAATTPQGAALAFGLGYERYAGGVQGARSGQADAIYAQYKSYDRGGFLPPGLSAVYNGTGRPEPVFTPQQFEQLAAARHAPDARKYTFNNYELSDPIATANATIRRLQFLGV